jgi:hypothetical protein
MQTEMTDSANPSARQDESAVAASSSAKAATAGGVGAAILGTLAKLTPLKWLFMLLPVIAVLPAAFLQWVLLQMDLRNFRDHEGFRARLFRDSSRRWFLRARQSGQGKLCRRQV